MQIVLGAEKLTRGKWDQLNWRWGNFVSRLGGGVVGVVGRGVVGGVEEEGRAMWEWWRKRKGWSVD